MLESLFGKQKYLEGDQQSKNGFTGLILGIGAIVSDLNENFIKQALESTPVKYVTQWKQEFLGQTLQGKRVKLLEQNLTE